LTVFKARAQANRNLFLGRKREPTTAVSWVSIRFGATRLSAKKIFA
jgi:hypothetical protein